ncbi:MAG: hypothetical protein IKL33_03585 [Alphaproteobacteria bacterium]|nr:hypothetical protein [Alphaproteobacteria bacterium]
MKAPTPLTSKKDSKVGISKLNSFQKFLIFLGLMIVAFTILPVVVVLFIGLLPTLTAVVTDTKNIHKITTIGCLNMSGLIICLHHIFIQLTSGANFSIREDINDIIIMLCAAAIGALLYYILPDLFAFIFKNSAQHRLKIINARLNRYAENWSNILPDEKE